MTITKEDLKQLKEIFPTREETAQGFAGVNQQFAGVNQQFAGVNQQFAGVDQRFAEVDQRFDGVNLRFDEMDRRFDEMDRKFDNKYSELVSGQDYIIKLLETRRDEDAIAAAEDRIFRRQLEDHERRIGRLETQSK